VKNGNFAASLLVIYPALLVYNFMDNLMSRMTMPRHVTQRNLIVF